MTTMRIAPPTAEHVAAWREEYEDDCRQILKPRPRLKISEWAERYRYLGGSSAEKGAWRNRRVPYLVEIMDAIIDPDVQEITVMKPARVGVTEGVILNAIGYFMHQDPSPILIGLPVLHDAETFSKKKLVPMLESSPALRELVPEPRSRDGTNTILEKEYPGGSITIVGTNSPRMLRMRDARLVAADEIDTMEGTKEGDPLDLLKKRADNAPNRKLIWVSSPSWKHTSRIEKKYLASDRRRYWMPCPKCGDYQVLMLGGKDKPYGLKWLSGRPDTVVYLCQRGCTIQERWKQEMHMHAEWRPDRPEIKARGYWFNAFISLFDGVRWPKVVENFLEVKDDGERFQVFVNTVLAETYELRGEKVEGDALFSRREVYAAEVPKGVGVLTAFVDVQRGSGGWLEVLVRGWGDNQESWRILHERIEGSIDDTEVHEQLDAILFRAYQHESGATLRIKRALIDSGDQASSVYAYVKPRQTRGVFASKGDKAVQNAPIVVRGKKPNDAGVRLMTIGTFTTKRRLFSRLKLSRAGTPGFMHFHRLADDADVAAVAAFDAQDREYFKQFAAEKLVPVKDAKGQQLYQYVQVADRNEAIDLEVGALAALHALGPSVYERLGRITASVVARGEKGSAEPAAEEETRDEEPAPRRSPPRRRGGYMSGWRR